MTSPAHVSSRSTTAELPITARVASRRARNMRDNLIKATSSATLPFSLTLLFATMWNCHAQPDARRKILHKFAKNSGSKHGFRCAIPGCPNRGVTQQCCKQRLCVACLAHTHHVQAPCSFCDLPVADIDKASGYTGKGSDPIIFPRCPHALHAECM